MATMHAATLKFPDVAEVYHYASLDGTLFLGVTRVPKPEDEAHVRTLFDGNGRTLPMRVHRDLLEHYGATIWTL